MTLSVKLMKRPEANAIGTEYVRAGLLPSADTARVQELLRKYLDLRVVFYSSQDDQQLRKNSVDTSQLQSDMWSGWSKLARGAAESCGRP